MVHKCPLCGSTLSENHYHRVIKLQERKEKVQKGELEKLKKQAEAAKRKQRTIQARAKQDVASAKKQAVELERKKSAIRDKRLVARIKKLEEEKKMLQKHPLLLPTGCQHRASANVLAGPRQSNTLCHSPPPNGCGKIDGPRRFRLCPP